jgi:hypothetical protein
MAQNTSNLATYNIMSFRETGTVNAVKLLPTIKNIDSYIGLTTEVDSHIKTGDTVFVTYRYDEAIQLLEKNELYYEANQIRFEQARNYERAMRLEDAAKLYDQLGMWDDAKRCRNKNKISEQRTPDAISGVFYCGFVQMVC